MKQLKPIFLSIFLQLANCLITEESASMLKTQQDTSNFLKNRMLGERYCNKLEYFDTYFDSCRPCDTQCTLGCQNNKPWDCKIVSIYDDIFEELKYFSGCLYKHFKYNNKFYCAPECYGQDENIIESGCDSIGNNSCNYDWAKNCIGCKKPDHAIFIEFNLCKKCETEKGYYISSKNGAKFCERCHQSCTKCSGPLSSHCESCASPFYLQTSGKGNQCVKKCDPGYYPNDNQCIKCKKGCKSCEYNISEKKFVCKECERENYILGDECVDCKDNGLFLENGKCYACNKDLNCLTCKSTKSCTSCENNKYLKMNSCVDQCDKNEYNLNGKCLPCIGNCGECKYDQKQQIAVCNKCVQGKYLKENTCVEDCGDGFFKSNNGICVACNKDCKTCLDDQSCSTCHQDKKYLSKNKQCVESCLSNEYFLNDNICLSCMESIENCQECKYDEKLQAPVCNQCVQGKYLQDNTCRQCSEGYFLSNDGVCIACNRKCKTCSNESTCSSCYSRSKLTENQQCELVCLKDEYLFENQCEQCYVVVYNCETCRFYYLDEINKKYKRYQCLDCREGYYLKNDLECVKY